MAKYSALTHADVQVAVKCKGNIQPCIVRDAIVNTTYCDNRVATLTTLYRTDVLFRYKQRYSRMIKG